LSLGLSEETVFDYRHYADRYVRPQLGARRVRDVTSEGPRSLDEAPSYLEAQVGVLRSAGFVVVPTGATSTTSTSSY
jgi:hypothetical protein